MLPPGMLVVFESPGNETPAPFLSWDFLVSSLDCEKDCSQFSHPFGTDILLSNSPKALLRLELDEQNTNLKQLIE